MSNTIQALDGGNAKCDRPATRLEDLRGRLDSCVHNFRRLNDRCLDIVDKAEGSQPARNDVKESGSSGGLLNDLNHQLDSLDILSNELSDRIAYFESTI